MGRPYTWEDCLRAHDEAVSLWLKALHVDYNDTQVGFTKNDTPIIQVMASPSRAFATVVDTLVKTGWIQEATAAKMRQAAGDFTVLPLPLLTIERGDPQLDAELSAPAKQIRVFNSATGQFNMHPWPGRYRTDYRVTLWCQKRFTDNYLREWVMSQFGGGRGTAYTEMLLPVVHADPWGTMNQSFKLVGIQDLSDLEGDGQRYFRVEFTFSLRTLLMRNIAESNAQVQALRLETTNPSEVYGDLDTNDNGDSDVVGSIDTTENLFNFQLPQNLIATQWPRTGTATVAPGTRQPGGDFTTRVFNSLDLTVTDEGDSVELLRRYLTPDTNGICIVSMAFDYISDRDVALEVAQENAGTATSAMLRTLPASPDKWTRVHLFTMVNHAIGIVSIAGLQGGTDLATVTVANVDIRQIGPQTDVPYVNRVDAGSEWHYIWTALAAEPSLIIAVLDAPSSGTFSVDDDATAPTFTNTQPVDDQINVGAVALIQPKASSVVVRIPKTVTLDRITLQRYAGAYHGNQI